MNIEKLLEYQTEDQKIMSIEEEIRLSQLSKDVRKIYEMVNLLYEKGKESEKKLNEIKGIDDSFKNVLLDLNEKISFLREEIDRCETLDQLSPVEKEINEINQSTYKLENKIKEIEMLEDIARKHNAIIAKWKQAYVMFNQKKNEFDAYATTMRDSEIAPIRKRMVEIEKELSPAELENYKKTKTNVKNAPFICEYVEGYCSGCHKDVEAEVGRKLRPDVTINCPECQRILYVR